MHSSYVVSALVCRPIKTGKYPKGKVMPSEALPKLEQVDMSPGQSRRSRELSLFSSLVDMCQLNVQRAREMERLLMLVRGNIGREFMRLVVRRVNAVFACTR